MQLPWRFNKIQHFPLFALDTDTYTHMQFQTQVKPSFASSGLFHPTFFWDNHCTEASVYITDIRFFTNIFLTSNYGCINSNIHYHFLGFIFIYLFVFWLHHPSCGILVPWSGNEPMPSGVEVQILLGSSHFLCFKS